MRALWTVAAILCTLLAVAFLGLFLRDHYVPAEKAIAAGQRVEINLKTGEIKQAPVAEEKPAAAEKKEEPKAPEAKAETKAEEPKKEEPKAKEEKKEAKEEEKAPEKAKPLEKVVVKQKEVVKPKEPVADIPTGPRVAIVIAGMGLSHSSTEQIFKLPPQISMSFSPYASDITQWLIKAGKDKHEVYLDLPMEPKDYPQSDPGPYALLINLDDDKNLERLNQVLKSGVGYHGLVSGPEEHFTEDDRANDWLLKTLKVKNLPFFFVARAGNKQLTQGGIEKSDPTVQGIDFVLDDKLTNEAIDAKLAEAEALAQKSGFATVLARPYPISAQRIEEWIKTLGPKGIQLVSLSQAKAQ